MFKRLTLAATLMVACNPSQQSLDSSTRSSSNRGATQGLQTSSDLTQDITIPSPWTNATDIPVSWGAIEGASEYQLDIATDAACSSISQSLRTKNTETHITNLAEGTWFLCLRWRIEPKVHQGNAAGLQLVIDRHAPKIEGEGIQSLALFEAPKVTVTDSSKFDCEWSTVAENLTITEEKTLTPKFSAYTAGTYFLQLSCVDQAQNQSEQSFSITLPADPDAVKPTDPVATPTPTPSATPEPVLPPTANAGLDLLSNKSVLLAGTATNATSYAWSMVSGPGTITFSAPTSVQTNVTASADGTYVLRLTATGPTGFTATDDMMLTWDATAPTVNAGQDVVIGIATILTGTVGADAVSYSWRKVSGTGTITFSSITSLTPTVSASADGTYVLELSAKDAAGNTATDQMTFQWLTTVPTVNVGPDLSAKAAVAVAPTVSNATTFAWSKVSGTGTITFSAPTSKNTNITASADGTYVIRLTVTNASGQTANDTLTLVWDTVAPTVNAGADKSANALFTQTGTASGASTYAWSKVSGTGTVTFGTASALATTITASADGSYTLRLTATDAAGNAASDDMILTWDTTPPNNVTSLTATPGTKSMALSWTDGGGGTQSYLVLRNATAAITDVPVRGTTYTAGGMIGTSTVVAVTSTASFADSNLAGGTTYYYKVFAYDALKNYNSGVAASAVPDYQYTLITPERSSFYSQATLAFGIQTYKDTTYVCRQEVGLQILDVTDRTKPKEIKTTNLGHSANLGWCLDVKVSGNYAFVADWNRGLVPVDITDPKNPVVKTPLPLTNASMVIISGNYAYVAVEDDDVGGGLAIVNITNPASPVLASYKETGGNASGIAKIGNYVYLAHRDSGTFVGLKVFNVTTPGSPQEVQSLTRNNVEELTVSGNYLYAAEGDDGFEIFDATNPASLVSKSVKALKTVDDYATSVSVSGNYVFVASYFTPKMYVYDATTKTTPTLAKEYTTSNSLLPNFVHVAGAYAYLSGETSTGNISGLEIIKVFNQQ